MTLWKNHIKLFVINKNMNKDNLLIEQAYKRVLETYDSPPVGGEKFNTVEKIYDILKTNFKNNQDNDSYINAVNDLKKIGFGSRIEFDEDTIPMFKIALSFSKISDDPWNGNDVDLGEIINRLYNQEAMIGDDRDITGQDEDF